jgi:hypothetical protein
MGAEIRPELVFIGVVYVDRELELRVTVLNSLDLPCRSTLLMAGNNNTGCVNKKLGCSSDIWVQIQLINRT